MKILKSMIKVFETSFSAFLDISFQFSSPHSALQGSIGWKTRPLASKFEMCLMNKNRRKAANKA